MTLLSTLCPSGIFHQHWLGLLLRVKLRPLSWYHDHGEDGGKVDETGQHLHQWGWWKVGSMNWPVMHLVQQTLNITGSSEEAIFDWTGAKSLNDRCWACPREETFISGRILGRNSNTALPNLAKNSIWQLPNLPLWPCCYTKRGRVDLLWYC